MVSLTPHSMKSVSGADESLNMLNERSYLKNKKDLLPIGSILSWNFSLLNYKSDNLEVQIFLFLHLRLF